MIPQNQRGGCKKEASSSHYRQSLEEVDSILKTIPTTLEIKKDQLTLHDDIFKGRGRSSIGCFGCTKSCQRQ